MARIANRSLTTAALLVMAGVTSAQPSNIQDTTTPTYPLTVTTIFSTSPTTATTDHVTLLEAWPIVPDPEAFPYTMRQTALTQRVIPPSSTTTLIATSTWMLWETAATDMVVGTSPMCAGECNPPALKPHYRCLESGRETRCAAQCEIKQAQGLYLWWCLKTAGGWGGEMKPMGRLCWDNGTAYEALLEPCDHTDLRPDCKLCAAGEEP
jgi:hypothetical protein